MKRSFNCLIVVCFFGLLFSCKKEDTGSIVGIWKATRIETKNCTKASDDRILELGANDCTVVSNIEYCVTIKYALNSDGTRVIDQLPSFITPLEPCEYQTT